MGHLVSTDDLWRIVTDRRLLPPPRSREEPGWQESWEHLCAEYGPALRRYAAGCLRRRGIRDLDPDLPGAVVGDFLARCMESGQLAASRAPVRSFRAWVSTHLRRFVNDWVDREFAAKRRPADTAPMEVLEGVAGGPDPALVDLDQGLVSQAARSALEALRQGRTTRRWGATYAAILDDLTLNDGRQSADLPQRIGVEPARLALLRHRARDTYARLLTAELRRLVLDDEALAELLRALEPYLP